MRPAANLPSVSIVPAVRRSWMWHPSETYANGAAGLPAPAFVTLMPTVRVLPLPSNSPLKRRVSGKPQRGELPASVTSRIKTAFSVASPSFTRVAKLSQSAADRISTVSAAATRVRSDNSAIVLVIPASSLFIPLS